MDIAEDTVRELIVLARAYFVKEGETDPDSGSNPIDDGFTDTLEDPLNPEDSREIEIREAIESLNEDQQADLTAMVFLGRGDFDAAEWSDARRAAKERNLASKQDVSTYLLGIPLLGDYLDEALDALGRGGLMDEGGEDPDSSGIGGLDEEGRVRSADEATEVDPAAG